MRRAAAVLAVLALAAGIGGALWTRVADGVPHEDLPPGAAARVNPLAHDPAAAATGAALFQSNCASCHGNRADGHGAAAVGLVPPPANFRGSDLLVHHSDAYLFHRISEGKPGTAMPSFRGALAEAERWAVITYLRSLEPADQ